MSDSVCTWPSCGHTAKWMCTSESHVKFVGETIVSAAIYNGVIYSLPAPARHHTILNSMELVSDDAKALHSLQGFLTSSGRFVNRVEAFYIAWKAKQIINKTGNKSTPELFSEDLW